MSLLPTQLWHNRSLPARWRSLPENSFIVSAVFEDLKERWTRQRIQEECQISAYQLAECEYPWAEITTMVPGEADLECARISNITGAAILTNDSDLLVHDLGPHGSVVLLNSVQSQVEIQNSTETEIQGLRLHPQNICQRLGIEDIRRFAFELKRNPHLSFLELLHLSKGPFSTKNSAANYMSFLSEYPYMEDVFVGLECKLQNQLLDPRVSELFWQFELPKIFRGTEPPRFYLGILHEDYARRCAWEQGRNYRALGYSILNLSRPVTAQIPTIHEFVRRGERIVAEQVTLSDTKTVTADLNALEERLEFARKVFGHDHRLSFWILFALSEIYRDSKPMSRPNASRLERLLREGYMGDKTDWTDIHLVAQIHAVLYSLRMLKQLIGITSKDRLVSQFNTVLTCLPPLHILLASRYNITRSFPTGEPGRLVCQLFRAYGTF